MDKPRLNDPEIYPSADVLERELGKSYPVYSEFMETLESDDFKLNPEWRFYKDGKAWLCKITLKKKTVLWLSVWPECFKLAIYFTEKNGAGIPELDIADSIKNNFLSHKPIGKLKPLVFETRNRSQLQDIYTVVNYRIAHL
jgi:hypothetical protein